ncbi:hypothetical protein G7046_g5261 [Stylonectria norvegica]|nr:hypothetical protein G7046_g5261 [Stylonectria norvegica]
MAESRFTPQNKTTHERLTSNTVGLVALSDFRKRRAQVLEQHQREVHEAAFSGTSTPDRSLTGTPDNGGSDPTAGNSARLVKRKKRQGRKLLSFDDDDEGDGEEAPALKPKSKTSTTTSATDDANGDDGGKAKFKPNAAVGIAPKAMTKSALRKEAAEREALRVEFIALQEAVKATEIAIPFVFYDGTNIPGGTVRVKKGDYVWVFLDKSRKVGADLGIGEKANARREWARVGVDDLMLHYDFYFFALNKSLGPGGQRLFDYSSEASKLRASDGPAFDPLITPASKAAAAKALPDINTLEGATDDPNLTKVVDRRWYEKNKHIYPASVWQEFDPEKDYSTEVRRDTGGNTFFFSK